MAQTTRILGITENAAGQIAETLQVRESGRMVALYYTGHTYPSMPAADKAIRLAARTITPETNGHPAAWAYDVANLVRCHNDGGSATR